MMAITFTIILIRTCKGSLSRTWSGTQIVPPGNLPRCGKNLFHIKKGYQFTLPREILAISRIIVSFMDTTET